MTSTAGRAGALLLALALACAFAQAPGSEPARGTLRLVVLSDINGPYGATAYDAGVLWALRQITESWRPDLVLLAGDLVAGQDHGLPDARFEEMWAAFDHHIAAPLRAAKIPYAAAMGNHDASSLRRADGGFAFAREREAAARYWQEQTPALAFVDAAGFPFDYSFSSGELFVLVWDASSAELSPETRAWAARALASPAAQGARLRLVMGHLPLYGVAEGRNRPGEVLEGGEGLRAMLEAQGVALYVSGHHHAFFLGKRGELIMLFAGGLPPRRLLGSETPPWSTVTLLDLDLAEAPQLRVTGYVLVSGEVIAMDELPERIDGLGGAVTRLDLSD